MASRVLPVPVTASTRPVRWLSRHASSASRCHCRSEEKSKAVSIDDAGRVSSLRVSTCDCSLRMLVFGWLLRNQSGRDEPSRMNFLEPYKQLLTSPREAPMSRANWRAVNPGVSTSNCSSSFSNRFSRIPHPTLSATCSEGPETVV